MGDLVRIKRDGKMAIVPKVHRLEVYRFSPLLEGFRRWLTSGDFKFEVTPHNEKLLLQSGFEIEPLEKSRFEHLAQVAERPTFKSPLVNFQHQDEASAKFKLLSSCAFFAEMGTGKTKMAIDKVNASWCKGEVDAVVILAKKGVHIQWCEGEPDEEGNLKPSPVESLTQKEIPFRTWAWKGKPIPDDLLIDQGGITWFSFNFDSIIHKKAKAQLDRICEAYGGRLAFVGDETHYLKNYRATRTIAAINFAELCNLKIIMTGTPIASNLEDEWAQFKVLDEAIIGHRYVSTFRAAFCVMGGFEGRQVVGTRNLNEFKDLTAPYVFRVKKEDCLDLPEKQYQQISFDLSKEQKEAIRGLKTSQTFTLPNGEEIFFEGAAPTLGKIQEISNGFLQHPDGVVEFPNPRLATLEEFLEPLSEKAILWCRYKQDVYNLMKTFGDQALDYFGETKDKDREKHKAAFINDPSKRFLVATTGAMAEGVDGLQKVCSMALYYSNTFNSIQRWQSEDRIHRIGMGDKAFYGDFVAKGCIDYNLVRNLRAKKNFSHLVLDLAKEMGIPQREIDIGDPFKDTEPDEAEEPLETILDTSKRKWEF